MLLTAKSNAALEAGWRYYYADTGDVVPLTGATPWMQIRNRAGGDTVIYDSDQTDHFTVDVNTGTITLLIPKSIVELWSFRRAEFDIVLVYPDATRPFISGTVELETGVTV